MQRPVEPFLLEMLGFSNELYAVLQAFTCFLQALSIPVVELCRLKCGNRTTLIVCSAATMLSYVLLARATNSWVLYLSRVIGGVQPGPFRRTTSTCILEAAQCPAALQRHCGGVDAVCAQPASCLPCSMRPVVTVLPVSVLTVLSYLR